MFLHKIKDGIKEHGFFIYAVYFIKRLLGYISDKIFIQFIYLFLLPVDQKRIKVPSFLKKSYTVRILDQYHDMLKVFPVSRKTLDYRFGQKSICLVVLKDQNPIGFLWIILKKYQEDILFCDLKMGNEIAWDFDLWILDEYRLTPAFSILWDFAFEFLANRNIKYIYSRISTLNNNSIDVHSRLGGHVVGKLLFIQYRNREICVDWIQSKASLHNPHRRKIINLDTLKT
ncbi:MAG: hypothetical protein NDI81_00810 [Desulfobacula sp.]|nr:hypothetical protein [Desulfobacula sp.]